MRGRTWQRVSRKQPPKPHVPDDVRDAADALAVLVGGSPSSVSAVTKCIDGKHLAADYFDIDDLTQIDDPEWTELCFICSLARSGLNDHQINELLGQLAKPYAYHPFYTAYSF